MKKSLAKIALVASLVLAGCGGGSGGDKNNETSPPPQNIPAKPYITNIVPYNEEPSRGIQLVIQDSSDNETGFVLERKKASGSFSQLETFSRISGTGARFLYTDLGLDKNTNYTYRINAYNASGSSSWEEKTGTSSNTLTSSIKVRPTKDSYVQETSPSQNFGNLNYFYISNSSNQLEIAFVHFNLPGLPYYSNGFHSATLKLAEAGGGNTFYPGPIGVYASPIASDWNENSITYNDNLGWGDIYGYGSHNPNLGTERQLFIDVSTIVNSWYSGFIPNKGFALQTTDMDRYCAYYSKDFSNTSEAVPILEVKYKW